MSMLTLEVQLDNNACVELCGSMVTLWIGEGLPVYNGSIEGLQDYPAQFNALLARGIIKQK